MKRSLLVLASLLTVLALILAACGGGAAPTATLVPPTAAPTKAPEPTAAPVATEAPEATQAPEPTKAPEPTTAPEPAATTPGMLPEVNPLEVTGDIIAAGSSTVFPLAEALAELFIDEGYGGNITIDSIGSGAGLERFCTAGETDIANASRAIREEEVENCGKLSPERTPIEIRVGTDALAVVVNPANDWIGPEGVTLAELAKLFSSEATNWSDVNPAWPAEPIKRFSPGTDSGTYDYFIEAVMDETYVLSEADEGKGEEQLLGASNLQLSEDDNVLVQGVEGDTYAIGYFGYAYYEENAARLQDLAIDGVSPSAETVEAGEYPLARPLFMYSDAGVMASKPQVAAFLNFVLSRVNDVIIEVGYFPASDEALDAARTAWLEGMGMESGAMAGEATLVALPEVNPLEVTGDIIAAGSSTVFPLAEALAELFIDEGYGGNITIDSIGSGAGLERFCTAGETDIANSSRAIKDAEVENCGKLNPARTPIEIRVGTDALAVVVNPANDWIGPEGITTAELAQLFSSETVNWSDVNPSWPAQPIKRFSPGTDSGTFDYFIEAVMDPAYVIDKEADKGKGEEQLLAAANLQLSEDDNVLVQGVEGDTYAIGYFGYAYYEENAARLQDLAINGVSPSAETVDAGEYPLARPLFMYSDAGVMASKPQVAAFLNFVLSRVNDVIIEVGYFPASDEALDAARTAWLEAMGQ